MDTNPTGRIMLEASTGMHGEIAETIAKEWAATAQDRDEWKDATIAANENQRRADAKAHDMQEQRDAALTALRTIARGVQADHPHKFTAAQTADIVKAALSGVFGKAGGAPPLQFDPAGEPKIEMTLIEREAVKLLNSLKAAADGGMLQLSEGVQMQIDVILMTASQRRVGVA